MDHFLLYGKVGNGLRHYNLPSHCNGQEAIIYGVSVTCYKIKCGEKKRVQNYKLIYLLQLSGPHGLSGGGVKLSTDPI
jgi:hypothetical protein